MGPGGTVLRWNACLVKKVYFKKGESCPGWPLENPPSMAGSKSPSDRALISTSFFDYRQSYLFFNQVRQNIRIFLFRIWEMVLELPPQ